MSYKVQCKTRFLDQLNNDLNDYCSFVGLLTILRITTSACNVDLVTLYNKVVLINVS